MLVCLPVIYVTVTYQYQNTCAQYVRWSADVEVAQPVRIELNHYLQAGSARDFNAAYISCC